MHRQNLSRWGKKVTFVFNIIILLSILLFQTGLQLSLVQAEPLEYYTTNSMKDATDAASTQTKKAFGKPVSDLNRSALIMPNNDDAYGATLECTTTDSCSDLNPGVYLKETMNVEKYWAPTDWGTPETMKFHITCDESISGCTQKDVYYHSVLNYTWYTPYTRSPTQSMTVEAYLSPIEDSMATGNITSMQCGLPNSKNGSCTVETWGILAASKINPSDSMDNHFYITRHVGGLGIYDSEVVDWTVEVSFDKHMVSYWQEDDAVCHGDCDAQNEVNFVGDPINTRTGAMTYPVTDISIQTAAGKLDFTRTYTSTHNLDYEFPLGYGWFQALSPRLNFTNDPKGIPGMVLYESPSGNIMRF
ncbi:MAG: hypothetical protein JW704_07965 [Anaerolineaceae bacterium]|nr:hypothetical protein [Anaerolineaceae bacterium]